MDTLSNTYQNHIHYRFNSYPLCILFYHNVLLCVFHIVYLNPDLIIHLFNWYYRKYISKSYQFQIKLIFITYIVVPKWATLCFFLFLLHLQTLPTIFFIEIISNTYQMHIHFRSNLYPLHILFYQNDLFCAFPVFTPIPEHVNSWFHWYSIKNRFIFIT